MAEQGIEIGAARRRQSANLSGVRKAAVLLVAVGEESGQGDSARVAGGRRAAAHRGAGRSARHYAGALRRGAGRVLGAARNPELHGSWRPRLRQPPAGRNLRQGARRRSADAGAALAGGGAGQPGQAAAHRSAAAGQAARLRTSADDCPGAGAPRPRAGLDGAGQPERGAQSGLHPAPGRDAAVFAGDGAEGGA